MVVGLAVGLDAITAARLVASSDVESAGSMVGMMGEKMDGCLVVM